MSGERGRAVSRTLIYGLGAFIRAATGLVMLPIYTRYLTPADYGAIEVLNLVVDLAALMFGARIGTSILKFWNASRAADERRRVMATAVYLTCLFNGLGTAVLVVLAAPLSLLMYGSEAYAGALALFASTLVFSAVIEIATVYLRVLDVPWTYIGVSLAKLALQLALNVWFVVALGLGLWGVVYATVLSSALLAVAMAVFLFVRNGWRGRRELVRPMLGFTWPMIITGLGMFFITWGDRYFLRVYQGIEAVGIYALAYRFGGMVFRLVWTPFMTFWEPRQFELMNEKDGTRVVASMFGYANVALLSTALAVAMFSIEIVAIMAAPDYAEAALVVPVVSLAYVFQAWTFYNRIALLHEGKPRYLATSTYYTVALIAGLYLLLIPEYGVHGAAWATAISMYLRWLMIHDRAQSSLRIAYPTGAAHLALGVCVGVYAVSNWNATTIVEFAAKCGLWAAGSVLLIVLLVPRNEIVDAVSFISRRVGWQRTKSSD